MAGPVPVVARAAAQPRAVVAVGVAVVGVAGVVAVAKTPPATAVANDAPRLVSTGEGRSCLVAILDQELSMYSGVPRLCHSDRRRNLVVLRKMLGRPR
jgi:hypothetical protein